MLDNQLDNALVVAPHGSAVQMEVSDELDEFRVSVRDHGPGLSLADRFCLATASRLGVLALTADRAWGDSEGIRQIR